MTKEKTAENTEAMFGGLKEETISPPAETEKPAGPEVMIRRDRIDEMPEPVRERLHTILDETSSVAASLKDGGDGYGLNYYYNDDAELGLLALISALGVDNGGILNMQCNALLQASGSKDDDTDTIAKKVTADIGLVASIAPMDGVEGMLAVQMAATHRAIMKATMQLNHAETIPQSDSAANRMTKLMNVYTRQVETLNKHRGKGQQKMTVEHVHVNEGGQAIIGTVEGGGGKTEKGGQPHALRGKD
ncbi:hypothetical protein [Sneathiella sp.]|uniref:hypothetical protein n=1 Tax=Sneathiella sp. TaxID=1964365 RepID=UPI0026132D2B|nr:hypothetical protein [Sneathiella sp.]MDF2366330.1 hypothetical protein [Sneathiella sp.]